jgi:transcriptional regulator with XRE-family HTH domain
VENEEPFGPLLRKLRMSSRVSLGELARRTHYSKSYLSKVEMGLRPLSERVARRCDGVLSLNGALIAAMRVQPVATPSDAVDAGDQEDRRWVLQMDADGSVWFQPVDRRSVFALGGTSLLALQTGGTKLLRQAHPETVVVIFADLFQQLRQLGQQAPPELVLPTLIAQVHTLQRIAKNSTGRTRSSSFILAARYAEYTGWMAQEAGQNPAALWWTDRAVHLAAEGGDTELAAYSLVRRALVSLYTGNALDTVELARKAQRHAGASPRVRGLAAQREAQGHALAGAATDCFRALEVADVLLAHGPSTESTPVLGSSTVANPVGFSTAWCLHDLGRSEEAADAFEDALRTVPEAARRFRTRWRVRQALALAISGEVTGACQLASALLGDLAAVNSATIRSDVVALTKTLSRWLTHPPVRDLYPALTHALRTGTRA